MSARYFDAHCHVQFDAYKSDRHDVIAAMAAAEVAGLVVGTDFGASEKAVAVAQAHPHLYASVGLHPNHEPDEWYEPERYKKLAQSPKVVAVGECGLDYYRSDASDETKKKQKNVVDDQLRLAIALDKPLILHARPSKGTMDAYRDLIDILTVSRGEHGEKFRGDVHFFVGGIEEARQLFDLGFTISYTAVITFARDYDDVVRFAPLDHLLSETDAPYVAPEGRRGERNDPLAVQDVVAKIAEIRGEQLESVRAALLENARRLFALPRL